MPDLEEPYVLPFTVLVDSAEDQPWQFQGLRCDADKHYRPMVVTTRRANLGRHPNSQGDYSIEGHVGRVGIERKSMADLYGTILGWKTDYQAERDIAAHRERFEQELANFAKIRFAVVVVEASYVYTIDNAPEWGVKSAELNAKILHRSVISYQQRFPTVQWKFIDSRRWAETYAIDYLRRYWRKQQGFSKALEGML